MDDKNFDLSPADLPYSIDAEQSIIGAIISNSAIMPSVIEKIKPE